MKPTFTVKLGQPILPGLVATGRFDGRTPSIACVTTGGKVIIHSPHESMGPDGQLNSLRYLNLNRKISSLAAGRLTKDEGGQGRDMLVVGTQSNLLAYDVERNADAFFAEVQDGVNAMVIGRFASQPNPMVIAGGNCSILGFDNKGSEAFWTVTGDNVSAMAIYDMDNTNNVSPYLLVGSDDFEIRVFRNEEVVAEITEADRVVVLHAISGPRFAYGLANGTVGVYANPKARLWRVKTKHQPTSLLAYDIDLDGVAEIFSGWSNGSFNVRRQDSGEVLFRGNMSASISAIVRADYRMDGNEEVIVISEAGEMMAYLPTDNDFGALFESGIGKEDAADQKMLDDLHKQKIDLIAELKTLDRIAKLSKTSDLPVGALPPNTELSYTITSDLAARAILFKVDVNTDCQIVNLIAVDLEGVCMVDREVLALSPRTLSRTACLPLQPCRNVACTIRLQTHLSTRSQSSHLIVQETDIAIPKFAAYALVEDLTKYPAPRGSVTFVVPESMDRVVEFINQSFLVARKLKATGERMKVGFMSVCRTSSDDSAERSKRLGSASPADAASTSWAQGGRGSGRGGNGSAGAGAGGAAPDGELLVFSLQQPESNLGIAGRNPAASSSSAAHHGVSTRIKIYCANMELAAEVVQELARMLKWSELDSEANFEAEFEAFEKVVQAVNECNAARTSLTADMAEESQRIKALIVRAEDSRLMADMSTMRKAYTDLMGLNHVLLGSYQQRASNHDRLLAHLKEVNQMIQKAANLRLGQSKSRVIAECRNAVKNNNMASLLRILQFGYEPSSVAPGKA